MDTKKISLIIFLVGLIIISIGFIIFFNRESSRKSNLRANTLITPKTSKQIEASPQATKGQQPTITEEQINQAIQAKRQQINTQAKGRALTDQELEFIGSPRETVIKDLSKQR